MGYTPATGWHWKITPEQIEKIKANDRETINKVYADNLTKFRTVGYGFCRRARCYWCLNDFLQQVYVDMAFLDYTDTRVFYYSLKRCYFRARYYRRCEVSLDKELCDDEDFTLANVVADDFNLDEYVMRAETVKETAPEIFDLLKDLLFRGNGQQRFDEAKEKKLRDIVEYVFAGYTFEQIKEYARGAQ